MDIESLVSLFEHSPSIKLLKADRHAPFIAAFLYEQFKQGQKSVWTRTELLVAFRSFLEELEESYPGDMTGKPEEYLTQWCSKLWLRREWERKDAEPHFELTRHSESVLAFCEKLINAESTFIGTGSRLELVIETLEKIVIQSSTDPQERLRYLHEEKKRIEGQIAKIDNEGFVETENPARLQDQFATACDLLKDLQNDFRAVEERFKTATFAAHQQIQSRQESRGSILRAALDANAEITSGVQGVSFQDFCRLLYSTKQQDRLKEIVERLQSIKEIEQQRDALDAVSRMLPMLLEEAEKVQRTTQRLSKTLRRLLDTGSFHQRQRLGIVLAEIRSLAISLCSDPVPDDIGFQVYDGADCHSSFMFNFWKTPPEFEQAELIEHRIGDEERDAAIGLYSNLIPLNWTKIRSNVQKYTSGHSCIMLQELIEREPPEAGVMEVLGYLQIAQEEGHEIIPDIQDIIRVSLSDKTISLTLPRVQFVPKHQRKKTRLTNQRNDLP